MGAEIKKYIYELPTWPKFLWDMQNLTQKLTTVRLRQGKLIGRMQGLGFEVRSLSVLQNLSDEILKSNEIEGEKLDQQQVRSSLARRLGIDIGAISPSSKNIEGIVEMMLDATQNYNAPLTMQRLFSWHASLFPTGRSGMHKILVGELRDDKDGPMQVISGSMGKEKIHFEAPNAKHLNLEMKKFLAWFNSKKPIDSLLKAGIAHLWFITLHPFDDGNGRIARAITDMSLAQSEESSQRFYSMSSQICKDRKAYYAILESTQQGKLDITDWLEWFLNSLDQAFAGSEIILNSVLKKERFWEIHNAEKFNERQRKILNRLLDGFIGKLTSSKWAAIAKCSQDTASRDIDDLLKRKILLRNPGGGRSTSYALK